MNMIGIVGSIRKDSIHRQVFNHYREIARDHFDLHEGVIKGIPMLFENAGYVDRHGTVQEDLDVGDAVGVDEATDIIQ